MGKYCKIQCLGLTKVPEKNWIVTAPRFMNRLIYMIGGEGGYIKNGKKIPFKKNYIYFIPGFADISMYSSYEPLDNRMDHSYANFELLPPVVFNDVIEFDPTRDPNFFATLTLFKTICDNCVDNQVVNLKKEELNLFKGIVIYLTETIVKSKDIKYVNDDAILKALDLMHKNISAGISISSIAKECRLTKDGFIRKFKKHIGETPYSYLKKLKIHTALNLRDSGFSLEEIADKCGYADATTLSHAISNASKTKPYFR